MLEYLYMWHLSKPAAGRMAPAAPETRTISNAGISIKISRSTVGKRWDAQRAVFAFISNAHAFSGMLEASAAKAYSAWEHVLENGHGPR